jgi:hypothetical protein
MRFYAIAAIAAFSLMSAAATRVVASEFIEVYPGQGSVTLGANVDFHISSDVGAVNIEVTRTAHAWNQTILVTNLPVTVQPVNAVQPWRTGAAWPVSWTFTIPSDWQPGLYDFRVRSASNNTIYSRFLVAVQPAEPGSYSKVAVLTNDSTLNAYNTWGGKSNYKSLVPGDTSLAPVVAMNRPGNYVYAWVDWKFPKWADRIGMPVEYLTTQDLHFRAGILDSYDILVLAGHSEYWSREMRSALEHFLERGGKLISLSGNTMWWSVRFQETPDGVQMISCKGSTYWFGPVDCPTDPALYTGHWDFIGQPETLVMGASWKFGGYVDNRGFYTKAMGYGGYFAEDELHWFWAGTGVLAGDQVGQAAGIAGYEADAPPLVLNEYGKLIVNPAAIDLPADIRVLGTTPAATSTTEGHGAIIHFPYGENGGEVLNCGSVDCPEGLGTDPAWTKAILNVLVNFGAITHALTDYDGDSVNDVADNCIAVANLDQIDADQNGTGDLCEPVVPVAVTIDVEQAGANGAIDLSNKPMLNVVLLSESSGTELPLVFDATQIDAATLRFGPGRASVGDAPSLANYGGSSASDMAVRFNTNNAGLLCEATQLVVSIDGRTLAGVRFKGSQQITTECVQDTCHP